MEIQFFERKAIHFERGDKESSISNAYQYPYLALTKNTSQ